jgi:hypothetical protein
VISADWLGEIAVNPNANAPNPTTEAIRNNFFLLQQEARVTNVTPFVKDKARQLAVLSQRCLVADLDKDQFRLLHF